MGLETSAWMQEFFLVGNTLARGGNDWKAWHYRIEDQGAESNHYPGFIPVEDILRRLIPWNVEEARQTYIVKGEHPIAITTFEQDGEIFSVIPSLAGRKGILRNDSLYDMGSFKDGYTPHEYKPWLLDLTNEIVGDDLGITSAILMQEGGRLAIEFSLPESIETSVGLTFLPNILAWSSFDGSLATGWGRFTTAVICDNTFQMARSEKDSPSFRLRHTKYSQARIAEARSALSIVYQTADEFSAEVEKLADWKVSDKDFETLVNSIIPIPETKTGKTIAEKRQEQVFALYRNDERAATWNGTALGVLQAFNTQQQHMSQVRKGAHRVVRNYGNAISGKFGKSDDLVISTLAEITKHNPVVTNV